MKTQFETGHATNVAHFDTLVTTCIGFGRGFNPVPAQLTTAALQTMLTQAKASLAAVHTAEPSHKTAANAREEVFKRMNAIVTRLVPALKAYGTDPQTMSNIKTIVRKLKGYRATPKLTEEEKKASADKGTAVHEISSSQLSFDNRLENFDRLIKLISSITAFNPNEADLKSAALTTLYNEMATKNHAVVAASVPLVNARIARNDILYKSGTGLVDTAFSVKAYIKSAFGPQSQQYNNISGLAFTRAR